LFVGITSSAILFSLQYFISFPIASDNSVSFASTLLATNTFNISFLVAGDFDEYFSSQSPPSAIKIP
jgi:hypothetical protein